MALDPRIVTLEQFEAPEFRIECRSCKRHALVERSAMIRRFGGATTLQECARQVAALKGCNRAHVYGAGTCAVLVSEVPAWTWGKLMHARLGGWRGFLTCHRRFASLKKVDSCPETVELDVLSLISVIGDDFPLARLAPRCKCPQCGTSHIEIDWFIPEVAPAPPSETISIAISRRSALSLQGALTAEEEQALRTGSALPEA